MYSNDITHLADTSEHLESLRRILANERLVRVISRYPTIKRPELGHQNQIECKHRRNSHVNIPLPVKRLRKWRTRAKHQPRREMRVSAREKAETSEIYISPCCACLGIASSKPGMRTAKGVLFALLVLLISFSIIGTQKLENKLQGVSRPLISSPDAINLKLYTFRGILADSLLAIMLRHFQPQC